MRKRHYVKKMSFASEKQRGEQHRISNPRNGARLGTNTAGDISTQYVDNDRRNTRAPIHGETHANHGGRTQLGGEQRKPKSRTYRCQRGIAHHLFPSNNKRRRRRNAHPHTAQTPRYRPGLATPYREPTGTIPQIPQTTTTDDVTHIRNCCVHGHGRPQGLAEQIGAIR